ncbi:hypothetical protein BX666DRAFT_2046863, partial [Dichotomocladium elegans]
LNLKALFISDNQTRDGVQLQTFPVEAVSQGFIYTTPLPEDRNISNMPDNDLAGKADLPMYFVPKVFGDDLRSLITNNSTDGPNFVFWQIALYLDANTVLGGGDHGSSLSRGYLSYIIALAAVFLVGVIFLRWWRVRQLREQMEYEAQLNAHAYNMQLRMKAKPLPVDLVNALPIVHYSPETVKNGSCAVCLEDYVVGQHELRILGCSHGFCVLCIDPWLTQKSTKCPICKYDCLPSELRDENNENADDAVTTPSPDPSSVQFRERRSSEDSGPDEILTHSPPSTSHHHQLETDCRSSPATECNSDRELKDNSRTQS